MRKRYLYFLLIMLSVYSCKPRQSQPFGRNLALENKRWVLREMNGKAITPTSDGKELFILFDTKDNTFGGSGNCNSMNGMYTVQDEMINIHKMATTEMACPNMDTESEYFLMLSKANRYELKKKREGDIDKESLILFNDLNQLAKFDAVNVK